MNCRDCIKGHCDRWDHLIASINEKLARIDVGDADHDRCRGCGGTIYTDSNGRDTCDCCGAPASFPPVTAPVNQEETIREVLLRGRRESAKRQHQWKPSDDDVTVTVPARTAEVP